MTVVGGGVIGLSIAWELAKQGRHVRLLQQGPIGTGASWAAAGILPAARTTAAVDVIDQLRSHSHERYPSWVEQIEAASGIDVGWRRCGGLYLASSAGEAASLAANLQHWRSLGIEAEPLTPAELARRFQPLAAWAERCQRLSLWVPDECQVRPPQLLNALAAACRMAGVELQLDTTVRLQRDGRRAVCQVVQAKQVGDADSRRLADAAPLGPPLQADLIVLCGGTWSGLIGEALGLGLSLVPIRGQMLLYRLATAPLAPIVNEGHRYIVPRDDGHLLVGSCEEEVGFRHGTTSEMLDMLAGWAAGVLPRLAQMRPVASWSGLRPATFDGFPLLGPLPGVDNVIVAAGHFRSGIHLAPVTAETIADMVADRRPAIDPRPLAAARVLESPHQCR